MLEDLFFPKAVLNERVDLSTKCEILDTVIYVLYPMFKVDLQRKSLTIIICDGLNFKTNSSDGLLKHWTPY